MRRADATYSNRPRATRIRRNRREPAAPRVSPKKDRRPLLPRWVPVAASLTLVLSITATVNFRAYSELSSEQAQHEELNNRVQQMTTENLGLQEEIYYLKNDTDTIEREAKKYGLVRPQDQSSRAGKIEKAEDSINRQSPTRK